MFEDDGSGKLLKKMAGYHQFHAVRVAVAETLRAARLKQEEEQEDQGSNRRPGGNPGDKTCRRSLAHSGFRKKSHDGVLCRTHNPQSGDAKPNDSSAD